MRQSVIVGVNYIISYQHLKLWRPKVPKLVSKLDICDDLKPYYFPEQSDWCNNMLMCSYNYALVLPVNVSRPYSS